jgi:hypothetical protein
MAKYLAQSKHLLDVELGLDLISYGIDRPHEQYLSSFIEAVGQSKSV